ncbi:MAG TPA: T9SS type A sorting domain-containing protein [Bacteroidota bacterium]|nr:T9SS type A sorting domain-containing protein [Bacteroidota bacterium]
MKIVNLYALIVFVAAPLFSQTATLYDVFPLNINRNYIYNYRYEYIDQELGFLCYHNIDSGLVTYTIKDSLSHSDSTIQWTIIQNAKLYHYRLDTTYWTMDTSTCILYENNQGNHVLTCSSLVWSFPFSSRSLYSPIPVPVYRFSNIASQSMKVDFDSTHINSVLNIIHYYCDNIHGMYKQSDTLITNNIVYQYLSHEINLVSTTDAVKPLSPSNPSQIQLQQNYPNPFNPSTIMSYSLPQQSYVRLTVYNTLGQKIQELVSDFQQAGEHQTIFNGNNLPSGIYYYRLSANGAIVTKKLLLLK